MDCITDNPMPFCYFKRIITDDHFYIVIKPRFSKTQNAAQNYYTSYNELKNDNTLN